MNRFKTYISIVLSASLVLACFPLSVQFRSGKLQVQEEKAEAVVPIAGAAAAFLGEAAAAVGLTTSQLVTTFVGVSAAGIGMNLAVNEGVKFGNTASDNLGNLIEAADYPPWGTLDEDTQNSWGSKQNYDSAKLNSLLDAFDLGDARDRFYSSGGANFEWQQDELDRLEQLGRIGTNWINNVGNSVQSILDTFSDDYVNVYDNYFGSSSFQTFHKEDYDNWPSGAPDTVIVNKGYDNLISYKSSSTSYSYLHTVGSTDIYWIIYYVDKSGKIQIVRQMFSKNGFNYGTNNSNSTMPSITTASSERDYNGQSYYYGMFGNTVNYYNEIPTSNMADNGIVTSSQHSAIYSLIPIILFGDDLNIGSNAAYVTDYPDDIESIPEQEIYYPDNGYTPNITFVNLTTEPETGTEPGGSDNVNLTEIISLLSQFKFDELYNLYVKDRQLISTTQEIVNGFNNFTFDVDGCLYVSDRHTLSVLNSLLSAFQGFLDTSLYSNGIVKVHDEGVYDLITDANSELITISSLLRGIQTTLTNWFGVDTATDVIGEVDFSDLDDKATGLVDTISTLAPFGAMLMLSEMIAILSQTGNVQSPELDFDFNFMPGHEYTVHVDLTWMSDLKPVINVFCVIILLLGLYGATVRLVEMEAAA